jgi:hypothetical protein
MAAERRSDRITEQMQRQHVESLPSATSWAGPLGMAKRTEVAVMARQPTVGHPLCTMKADDKAARDERTRRRCFKGPGFGG